MAPLETTVTPNSKDVREGGQEASPKRESGRRETAKNAIKKNSMGKDERKKVFFFSTFSAKSF